MNTTLLNQCKGNPPDTLHEHGREGWGVMGYLKRSLTVALGCLASWIVVAHTPLPAIAAQVTCADGETPAPFVRLAVVDLPPELPRGSSVVVTRQIIPPGESVASSEATHTAYIVVSGVMEFQQPPRGGVHLEHPALCQPENGVFSGGGVEEGNADGWMQVEAGSTLVADEWVIHELRNAGSEPLEVLLVIVSVPEIDPETGKPLNLQGVDRGNEERRQERRTRKEQATPTP